MSAKQQAALLRHQEITGLRWIEIARQLSTSDRTIQRWVAGDAQPPGFLDIALKAIRREMAAASAKGKMLKAPVCHLCNKEIELKEVRRGFFVGSHRCLSGVVVKVPARPMDEVLRALTPVVTE